ncbi:MAG TPA: GxxExxY protein [Pyrinomonadaceae bacterium]|nr:GxxExxY protein [Pyrinomonadaceae bacterium]
MTELVLKEEVYEIVGAAMDVYYQLGRGFLEPVYQEALQIELSRRAIPFEAQKELTICYKGVYAREEIRSRPRLLRTNIAELKVCERLQGQEVAQVINYLKATGCRVGLLINFGSRVRLEWRRYVL